MTRRLIVLVLCTFGLAAAASTAAEASSMFRYDKQGSPINGIIRDECGYECETSWFRAGSGNGGTDGCEYGNWIPNGTYDVQGHWEHYDGTIKGRVWYLGDHYCSSNGVWRTELFVHTEENSDNTELCGDPYYDEHYCWDGDGDYYSLGCIKVARLPVHSNGYSDIGFLNYWDSWYPVDYVVVQS